MAGDRRATAGNLIWHRSMEKVVAGRSLQRRGDRRRRRSGDGDDPAVPAAARALREGRGFVAEPRGQGQPAVDDGPRQPPGGDAGHGRRPDLRRLRHAARRRAAVGLRRHRWSLRGARLRRHRLGQPARRHRHQGRLPHRHDARRRDRPRLSQRCGRRPTPTRRPAGPTPCAASTRSSPPSRPTVGSASATTSWRRGTRRSPTRCGRR